MSISVVIPARGHAHFLGESISSVLASEGSCVTDVIVVSDHDMGCHDVASSFDDPRVVPIMLDRHCGAYVALNTGLTLCGGDWVTFVGADDYIGPDRLSRMLFAANRVGPNAVVNTWNTRVLHDGSGGRVSTETLGGVFMYSRVMMSTLGGFRDWVCNADSDLYWRSLRCGGERTILRRASYFYRSHGDQLTVRPETSLKSELRKTYEEIMATSGETFIEPVVCTYGNPRAAGGPILASTGRS